MRCGGEAERQLRSQGKKVRGGRNIAKQRERASDRARPRGPPGMVRSATPPRVTADWLAN